MRLMLKKAYCVFGYQCNNNCRICAVSSQERARKERIGTEELVNFLIGLPREIRIVEISGGEPTIRSDFFTVLEKVSSEKPHLKYHLLTNGRMLSSITFAEKLADLPVDFIITALHSATPERHDWMTRAEGSYMQTIQGVRNALDMGFRVSLKTIVNKSNYRELENIATFVCSRFDDIDFFSFHALDLTGNALKHASEVAVRMSETIDNLLRAVTILDSSGIRVRIYGYPYCMVSEDLWKYIAPQPKLIYGYKSPSLEIVNQKFDDNYGLLDVCEGCSLRYKCSGLWYTYVEFFGKDEIVPVGG